LDLSKLVAQLNLPTGHTVDKIKYFTARASGAEDPDTPIRQQAYLNALSTLSEVEVHFGNFLSKTAWRPLINLPVAGATIHSPTSVSLPAGIHDVNGGSLNARAKIDVGTYHSKGAKTKRKAKIPRPINDALVVHVHTMEEKGSDVNLAAHLLNDAWKGLFDAAVVISNDTDLVTPISMVSVELKKPVTVACPSRWGMAKGLRRVASFQRHIRPAMLNAAQFPDPIPGTTYRKPAKW